MTTTDVDIMYSNEKVFLSGSIRREVFTWLTDNCDGWHGFGVLDREPDDGFKGETFQFVKPAHALMFKLTWGGV